MIVNDLLETKKFVYDFSKNIVQNDIICLVGDIGSGKTVITKYICEYFGIKNIIISPTFNLLKTYTVNKKNSNKIKFINHIDVYRLNNSNELLDIGFNDLIYDDNVITIIEWAELVKDIIPEYAKWIYINKIFNEKTNKDTNKREIIY